jgi:FtsP/CotA-like multicopper oxidase with cupredoxin domain
MATRDIYLKIEEILGYSPVDPEPKPAPPKEYRRDCMRTIGHESGTIPLSEANARRLTALVYREYLDANYLIPKPDKLVAADVNEPSFSHRVPGTVIYARPGDHLKIHVLNADSMPHSLHVHGLRYGIESDGSWPFGTQATDGRRSDEICPGQSWTYAFDVTDEMIGAWPFHDHSSHHIAESINRGLFGGIVVRPRKDVDLPATFVLPQLVEEVLRKKFRPLPLPIPPIHPHVPPQPPGPPSPHGGGHAPGVGHGAGIPLPEEHFEIAAAREFLEEWMHRPHPHVIPRPPAVVHAPLFVHYMRAERVTPAFNSGPLAPGAPDFEVTFGAEGVFPYHCELHPVMQGKITIAATSANTEVYVNIQDNPVMAFSPASADVKPGGKVKWKQTGVMTHTVTEDAAGLPTFCVNGRAFVGNTPTIVAETGQKIRWYVFNLDVSSMMWHNFHPHGQRWQFAGETIDIRAIGPAESFVVETIAPPVILLPPDVEKAQDPKHRPKGAKAYELRGEFLFHCHLEMHMMTGMVGLVRVHQTVWLTQKQADQIAADIGLPLDPGNNSCPPVDPHRCASHDLGMWETVVGNPEVAMMHSALLPNTTQVIFWGYTRADQTRLWDYSGVGAYSAPANQPADVAPVPGDINESDLWSSEHAFLNTPEGTLLAHGGFSPRQSYLFNPATSQWSRTAATAQDRFYATTFTLADGRILTLFGSASKSIEVYDPAAGTWSAPKPLPTTFAYLYYPWTYLLPDGRLFIAGPTGVTRRFDWTANPIVDDPAQTWPTIGGNRSTGGEKGTSVLLPLRPPNYEARALIAGGNTGTTQQTAEIIDLSAPTPVWTSVPNLNQPRPEQVNSVLLPDGRIFLAGGVPGSGGPVEIFDSTNPTAAWQLGPVMAHARGYHSSAILLADGSVLMGGDPPAGGAPTPHERYFPWYFFRSRPVITNAPAAVAYGSPFAVQTPSAAAIAEVVLLRPGAVTHGFNMSQRFVGCAVTGAAGGAVQTQAPPDGNIAPPGYYLLFIVTGDRVPSLGRWIRVTP